MRVVAGVDGCPGGWLCITRDLTNGTIESVVYPNAHALINQKSPPMIIAVDKRLTQQLLSKSARTARLPIPSRSPQRQCSIES